MYLRPVKVYAGSAIVARSVFDAGIWSTSALPFGVPTTFGLVPHPPPLGTNIGDPPVSTLSASVRPNVGVPQNRTESLVWKGPRTASALANWISAQPDGRVGLAQRYLSHAPVRPM